MSLINIIKNNLIIQNLASSIISIIPPYLHFTLAKYLALKKAFLITAQDDTRGSYLEFGVFTGSTFNHAMKENKKVEKLGYKNMDCEFVGFDSFNGFGHIKKEDEHPHFIDEIFQVNEEKVLKNIAKQAKGHKYRIVKGFYEDTIKNKTTKDLKIDKAKVIMIDCDLKEPTALALAFIKPSLQEGTIILFDDYAFFKGSKEKGEYGAFADFKKKNPEILFRRIFDYGYGSRAFIVHKIN
tara:strand:+ start:63 stop:779 length:717 start_codon:yes stop_codon:yes gene_type:complete